MTFNESVELEVDDCHFTFEGKKYSVVTTITHNLVLEDVGIGHYEFWGMRGVDKRMRNISHFENADFEGTDILPFGEMSAIDNPSKELLEAAEEAAFNHTYERAEEMADE